MMIPVPLCEVVFDGYSPLYQFTLKIASPIQNKDHKKACPHTKIYRIYYIERKRNAVELNCQIHDRKQPVSHFSQDSQI